MKSLPLRRTALAMLLGLALLTTGCAVDTDPQPTGTPTQTSASAAPTPTPTDETAPAPDPGPAPDGDCAPGPADAPAGTAADPYAVGEEIVAGCFTVVVTELDADATQDVQVTHPDEIPADGAVFAVVKVMIARTGGDPADVGTIGIRYAASPTEIVDADSELRLEEQSPPMGTLSAGQASGGTLVFEATNSSAPAVVLSVPGSGTTEIWVTR
jgi:hypothetical protein